MVKIRSKPDPKTGQPLIHTAKLLTGLGDVQFQDGVAECTLEQAALLANQPNYEVINESGDVQIAPVDADGAAVRGLPLGLQDASEDELDLAAQAIEAYREGRLPEWASEHAPPPEPAPADEEPAPAPAGDEDPEDGEPGGEEDPITPAPGDTDVSPELAAAKDHLRADGEHVPKTLPDGFEERTGDGEPRCYARKADETQCSNPAIVDEHGNSTYACGMARHKQQVAQLP